MLRMKHSSFNSWLSRPAWFTPVLLLLIFLSPVSSAAETDFSVTVVKEEGKLLLLHKGAELFSLIPVYRDGDQYTFPADIHMKAVEKGTDFSGAFKSGTFSGNIRFNKGLSLFLRFYPEGDAPAGTSGAVIEGSFTVKGDTRIAAGGFSLVSSEKTEDLGGGKYFLPESAIHITSAPSSYLSCSLVPEKENLPFLMDSPEVFPDTPKYSPAEMTCMIADENPNPFKDPGLSCRLTSPSGKTVTIRPFFTRDFVFRKDHYSETGVPVFRFRFTPGEQGEYSWILSSGKQVVQNGSFRSLPSDDKGFIRYTGENRYFTYSDGDIFFPVGINLCWSDDMFSYMDRISENGINFMRLWLCTWGYDVEGRQVRDFRLDMCHWLDEVFRYAQKKHIRIMLCLNNFYDFKYNSDSHGYFRDGLCQEEKDFFLKKEAIEVRTDFLEYMVSRYAAFTSLAAWETWNEVDYAISPDEVNIAEIEKVPASILHFADPYGRAVSSSLGVFRVNYDLWDLSDMDFVQYHVYIPKYTVLPRKSSYGDSAYLIKREKALFVKYRKPLLLSEFGYNGTNEDNPNNDLDPEGIMLHNSLWASTAAGWSGSAMHWWWDTYIEENGLFYLYKPLAGAVAKFRFTQDTVPFDSDNIRKGALRVMGIKHSEGALFWVQDKKATWEEMKLYNHVPEPQEGLKLRIGTFTDGEYTAEWINTFTGEVEEVIKARTEDRYLVLTVPDFKRDIACVVGRK